MAPEPSAFNDEEYLSTEEMRRTYEAAQLNRANRPPTYGVSMPPQVQQSDLPSGIYTQEDVDRYMRGMGDLGSLRYGSPVEQKKYNLEDVDKFI